MVRLSLQCLRVVTGLAILLLIACSTLFVIAFQDMLEEAEAQSTPAEYQKFLPSAHHDLAINGVVVAVILASLIFAFIKITRSLKHRSELSSVPPQA